MKRPWYYTTWFRFLRWFHFWGCGRQQMDFYMLDGRVMVMCACGKLWDAEFHRKAMEEEDRKATEG